MKRRDVLKLLEAAGLTFDESGRHTKVYRDGRKVSVVPRHTEIAEKLIRDIEKQTGVELRRRIPR